MGALNILYDSHNFCVAEFGGASGIELLDKQARRSGYFEGPVAARFRSSMAQLYAAHSGAEAVDDFLGTYEALLTNSVHLH